MTHKKKDLKPEDMSQEQEKEIKVEVLDKEPEPTELELMSKERDEWKDKYLRSMAEFENYRRRSTQEKTDWIKRSTEKLALEVCDVLDNFERALLQMEPEHAEDKFVKGILLIEQQLRSVLLREGVKKIEALGAEFDPGLHDALAHIPSDYDENIVAAIIQNGYTMNDKVIRPVRVAVSNGNELSKKQENNEE